MHNELFSIGPITFYGYGLMIAVAIIAAYVTTEIRAKRLGMNQDTIFGLVVWCAIGGLLGAKLLYVIVELPSLVGTENFWSNLATGFVVYGGIIGGILTGFIYCKVKKLIFLDYFDLAMPSIAIAQGFGRIGCFLAGCCYGVETDSCIGIVFHNSEFAPNNVSLVPTQLLSSGLDFLHFFALIIFAKYKKARGQVAALYLIFYSVGRYVMEMFRGDLIRGSVGRFSTSQFISIFLFIAGVALFVGATVYAKKHPDVKTDDTDTADDEDSDDSIDSEADSDINTDENETEIADDASSTDNDTIDNEADADSNATEDDADTAETDNTNEEADKQ